MHSPYHASDLPDHITPIPMPDTCREAELLVLLLEMGLYPTLAPTESQTDRPQEE